MDHTEKFLRGRDTAEKLFTKRKLERMADTGDRDGSKHGFLSQDEGNEIKRKLLSEFSPEPHSSSSSSSSLLENSPRYEVLEEIYQRAMVFLESLGEMAGQAKRELDLSIFPEWKDPSIPEMEELLIKNLSVTYHVAIRKIVMCGYSEEIAKCAVLRSGPYINVNDIVSSVVSRIVDGALDYLEREKEFDTSKSRMFEDFDNLVEYMVLEMICMLREVRPSLSVIKAMWYLLLSDLNLPLLCSVLDRVPLKSSADEQVQGKSSSDSTLGQQVNSEPQKSEIIVTDSNKRESEPDSRMLASQLLHELQKDEKESGRKINVLHLKKDLPRQKTFQLEKSYEVHTSKANLTSLGTRPLDKKPNADGVNLKNSSTPPEANPKTPMPMPQEKAKSTQKSQIKHYCAGIPYDESQGKYVARDKKDDELIQAAVSRCQALQKEDQGWNEWAQMTVKMTLKMLVPEQAELETLRLEKKETEKFIKEKQTSEESTILSLMAENSDLKKEAKDAKEKDSLESNKRWGAILKEGEAFKKCQSIGNEKAVLQDELTTLKCKTRALQQGMEKSKAAINQSEVQRGHEEREKMKLLKQAENIRKERERSESVAKKELEKRKDEMTKIEEMMAELKLKIEGGRKEESL